MHEQRRGCRVHGPWARTIVFLDVQMPEMDGFEVMRAIAESHPLVILTSAHGEHALRAFEADVGSPICSSHSAAGSSTSRYGVRSRGSCVNVRRYRSLRRGNPRTGSRSGTMAPSCS